MEILRIVRRKYYNSATWDYVFAPKRTYIYKSKIVLKFEGNCSKQNEVYYS